MGVDMDGSVHNRSELIVTQAYFKRKASSVLHLSSMHSALVPGGVSGDQYTDEPLKRHSFRIQYSTQVERLPRIKYRVLYRRSAGASSV